MSGRPLFGRGRWQGWLAMLLVAIWAVAVAGAAQKTYLIVITGVEGDQEYGALFRQWALSLINAAKDHYGVPADNVLFLADHPEHDPGLAFARSTRENVEKAFKKVADEAGSDDQVFVVLIGHGSFDGQQGAFNLPGPDLTATDYARLLGTLHAGHVIFVDTSASSGALLKPLAGPGRTIITATATGGERNETKFPSYFVEAFTGNAADADQDGKVSVLEAFDYAKTKVQQEYQRGGLLLSEHAMLEDGAGGKLAATESLASEQAQAAASASITDPTLRGLLTDQHALEDQIAALKLRKDTMDPDQYEAALEKLLTDLALKTRAIRQLEEKK